MLASHEAECNAFLTTVSMTKRPLNCSSIEQDEVKMLFNTSSLHPIARCNPRKSMKQHLDKNAGALLRGAWCEKENHLQKWIQTKENQEHERDRE